jgi:hypothetical protein
MLDYALAAAMAAPAVAAVAAAAAVAVLAAASWQVRLPAVGFHLPSLQQLQQLQQCKFHPALLLAIQHSPRSS